MRSYRQSSSASVTKYSLRLEIFFSKSLMILLHKTSRGGHRMGRESPSRRSNRIVHVGAGAHAHLPRYFLCGWVDDLQAFETADFTHQPSM
jgi:hypothetical protein